MALAALDALGVTTIFGVSTDTVRAEGGGYQLEVRYPSVSRPALASPFQIEVRRPDGFEGPLTIAVSRRYLALWDANGLFPTPSSETSAGGWVAWTFEPPVGDTFSFSYDARIEPGAQQGRSGNVAVLEADAPVAEVAFRTRLLP